MLLDWERFRDILESNSKQLNNNHAQLLNTIDHSEFLLKFLAQLLQELKETSTVNECAERYPKAASILTLASIHPYISYNPSIATLLISCLIEYSKLDLLSSENKLDLTLQANKPARWCITRLRRLINEAENVPSYENESSASIVKRISNLIESKQDIDEKRITRLTDACLGLIHDKDTPPLIEKLVDLALRDLVAVYDATHFDPAEKLLSYRFLYQLIVQQSNDASQLSLRRLYSQWSDSLKIKLLGNYSEILEIEILYIVDEYTKKQYTYMLIDTLDKELAQNHIIRLIQSSAYLCEKCSEILSTCVVRFQDWKFVRLTQCLFQLVKTTILKQFQHKIDSVQLNDTDSAIQHDLYDELLNYVYKAPVDRIELQRNMAWCVSLSSVRLLLCSVNAIVQWCNSTEPWTSKMENHLVYVNWVIYPTLDLRNSESLSDFRSWVQSSQGNDQLYSCLPKLRHNLLNSNAIVMACFVISLFLAKIPYNVDQIKLLIENVYDNSAENNSEDARNDEGSIYILLDCLYDIASYATYYPRESRTHAHEMINFVHERYRIEKL